MSPRASIVVIFLAGFSLSGRAAPLSAAEAQDVIGVIRSVDAKGHSLIIKKTKGELLEYKAGATAKITLDGKPSTLDSLMPGMKVVGLDARDDSLRTLKVETEPVRLRVSITVLSGRM